MSFNYPSLNGSGLPAMLPLLTNLTNGNHFLPSLAASQQASLSQAVSAGLFQAHNPTATAPLTENALEFSRTQSKLCSIPGAGPMDLETLNQERDSNSFIQSPTGSELSLASSASARKTDDNSEKNFSAFNPCDVMYNMGIPSQNLMMMSGVMNMVRDASSMVQMLPQFSLLNQMPVQAGLPSLQAAANVSTANLPDTNTVTNTIATTAPSGQSVSGVAKESITCASCILLPPNPNALAPSTRERPSGCRTVFVGGLPENITEDIIREVFERCGEITTLRLSKKNFCHIRFVFEASVDSAIYLSGYRIRINNQSDAANCGRLHVDFAQARDDQYEFECKQRQWQREQRHRERVERDRLRPSSPPIVYFSEHEASSIAEKLKQDDSFTKAVQIFITWLERGDCNKKNSNTFYSMIQSTNSHVRRMLNEKSAYQEELNKAKESHRKHMQSLSTQLSQIERVFGAASHKKVWDHFTKAQRKNIDLWKKQSLEIQVPQESLESHDTDEMEMSDEEDAGHLRYGKRSRSDTKDIESKKSEPMAYANSSKSLDVTGNVKDQQLKVLHETIRNLQTQLLENKTKEKENLSKIDELESKLKQANVKELLLKTRIVEASKSSHTSLSEHTSDSNDSDKDVVCVDDAEQDQMTKPTLIDTKAAVLSEPDKKECASSSSSSRKTIDVDDARLIGLISSFLVVHPLGASLDNILTYVQQVAMHLRSKDVEDILRRYKCIFSAIETPASGCDNTNVEPKWKFCGFEPMPNSPTIVIND